MAHWAGKSAPRRANSSATSCWRRCRMLTAKRWLAVAFSSVREPCARETSTSSGSSETEVNELSVMPAGWPWCSLVTTQTPVAKAPTTSRKSRSMPDIAQACPIARAGERLERDVVCAQNLAAVPGDQRHPLRAHAPWPGIAGGLERDHHARRQHGRAPGHDARLLVRRA